jgi:GMP synthase (glutamine-hydrolysing)
MILILDFGSQYTQLIARRIREENVFSKILNFDTLPQIIIDLSPKGIILSGGPASIYDKFAPSADPNILKLGLPILGICYGMQWLCKVEGGIVEKAKISEYGPSEFHITDESSLLFFGIPKITKVWMSHGDEVKTLPLGYKLIGRSGTDYSGAGDGIISAIENTNKKIYGLQFHPEVVHTDYGREILRNFIFRICKSEKDFNFSLFTKESINRIKEEVAGRGVICGVSGGIDSTTTAKIVHEAVKENLVCVFVENGLTRKGEKERVVRLFDKLNIKLQIVEAEDRFLKLLKGVTNPEEKRKRIGKEFIKIFEEIAQKYKDKNIEFLAQGTLYPDVIESQRRIGPSSTIKTHHNVGGLPKRLKFKLIEPLRELFKDETREIARLLGIPEEVIATQPFPGPGLAVRIIGEVTKERLEILKKADFIIQQELTQAGLYDKLWQSFAVLLPIKSVGIKGDARAYGYVICLRAVDSVDGMTADWSRLDYTILSEISKSIINQIPQVTRVVYDITSKPPATIEWE